MKSEGKRANSTKMVVLGGVSIIAVAVGFRMIWSGPQTAPAASVTSPADPTFLSAEPTQKPVAPAVAIAWPTGIARDPFSSDVVLPPPAAPSGAKAEPVAPTEAVDVVALAHEKIQLKGTVLGEHPLAMMNGRVFQVGEVVEGFKIIEIKTNQITVERDGSRILVEAH